MKKFFTNIPLQVKDGLISYHYEAVGNEKLNIEGKTSYPILTAISGYVEKGEEFRLIAVCPDSQDGRRNRDILETETNALCEHKGFHFRGVETVSSQTSERVADHAALFQKLIEFAEDDDELFACMTYGTKLQSHILTMAVQYAYRVKQNASISCIVYGYIDRTTGKPGDLSTYDAYVYDETALIHMDEIVRMLAERKVSDPKAIIDNILGM